MGSNDDNKIVLVGDVQCGKTGLIYNHFADKLPDCAVPTIYKEYRTELDIDGRMVPILLWIVPAQEHYNSIRTVSYENSKAVILCFAIDNPESLTNVTEKWYPEVKEFCPDAPIILVGNKVDLRSDENTINELASKLLQPISYEQGKEVAENIKAVQYFECSGKNGDAVKEMFKAAVTAIPSSSNGVGV